MITKSYPPVPIHVTLCGNRVIVCDHQVAQLQSLPAIAGDTGDADSIPEPGRSPGEGNDNPLHYPCLGNPMDRGTWKAIVHGVTKSQTQLSVDIEKTKKKKK